MDLEEEEDQGDNLMLPAGMKIRPGAGVLDPGELELYSTCLEGLTRKIAGVAITKEAPSVLLFTMRVD
jgi:hypothetical protein